MSGFWFTDELGEEKFVTFSLCSNGRWIDQEAGLINFDCESAEILSQPLFRDEVAPEVWSMLLQVLNLQSS